MKLIIIRHGESEADILKVHEGRADFSLTNKEKQQAKLLSKWIASNEEFDVILSSPLKRAKETAAFIRDETGKRIVLVEDLMEWDNGLLAGLPREEAERKYPLPKDGRKPHHTNANTESMINFRARAETFLSRLKEEYPKDAEICMVSHGGMINMLYRSLLNLPMMTEHSISCGDTSIHKFMLSDGKCHIEYINRLGHLEELE
ncbi:histidine phosphatase family protein [Isachenkonia alkalipeptolytica]|uniref:Histidine phosphatase family protein n=1 Tax=Isachenkonia alkalipeptolytica TaxID=2565777 RepID=A0AA43XK10_9CLOT|nr:histidine phosphatase family protein [Isachenkonia alkalipeptolytica]NBG88142.1 histidine phosphatase family protein [Isachenkonia alkalipeptolytica]